LKPVEFPFHAGEIESFFADLVLFEMKDVAALAINEIGNGGIESFAVRALHEKNGAILQDSSLLSADILLNFGGETGVM